MKRWLFTCAVITLLAGALWVSIAYGRKMQREASRLRSNQTTLLSDIQTYRIRDSLNAATVRVLTMKSSEMEGHFETLTALVKDMGVKMRRVESIAQNALESRYDVATPVRDTIVIREGIAADARVLHFDNGHLTLDGLIEAGQFHGQVVSRDTLTQVVHRVPRRFLFIRFGTRELRQEIVSSNPHSRIVYSRYLKLEK